MVKDRRGKKLKVGDCVLWYDPDPETRDLNLTRLWVIDEIYGDDEDSTILISDELGCESEVFAHELELYFRRIL